MKKAIAAILLIAAIALPQAAIAVRMRVLNNDIYQVFQNGKKYLLLLGDANSQITMSWQPPTIIPSKIPPRKAKTYTLNECGFKAVVITSTFPGSFTTSFGPVALVEEFGYATQYLTEAPVLPLCKSVGTEKIPYIIQGWQP